MEMQHTTSGTVLAHEVLTSAEAAERLQQYCPNAIVEAPTRSGIMLLQKFWGVIPWMLEAAVILDLFLARWAEAAVIAALLVFQAGLGFYQERRAKRAVALLRQRLSINARVRGAFWSRPLPGRGLLLASAFDIILATLIASLGWLMTAIPLSYIGGLLLFALVFLVLGDGIKAVTFKAAQYASSKRSRGVHEMTASLP